MTRVFLISLLALSTAWAQRAELDRIVAVVNGQVILESEVADNAHWDQLAAGRPPAPITDQERAQALERLIDQALIQQQIASTNYVPASATEVESRLSDVRKQLLGETAEPGWEALLARYQLTPEGARERIAAQLNITRFINLKLRPSVYVNREAIQKYYQERYVPEMRKSGVQPPPLAEVSAQIENILAEEQVGKLFDVWLQGIRSQSDIRRVNAELAGK